MSLPDLRDIAQQLEQGETRAVLPVLYQLAEQFPAWSAVQVLLARALQQAGRWDEALTVWQRVAFWLPDSPVVQQGGRVALRQVMRPVESRQAAEEPDLPDPLRKLAQVVNQQVGAGQEPSRPTATLEDDLDLDRLIAELSSARIEPRPDLDDIPPPELEDDVDDLVSETLALIYAAQQQYEEAARVYEKLALQHPEKATHYHEQAAKMREKAAGQAS
ncbi:MAG: tetratricopeptide repeat protein [Rhodothermus sp.]|nr:tetratricopeptide repeat protein [Rhodothermus sp.]